MWRYLAFHRIGVVVFETSLLVFCVLGAYYFRYGQWPYSDPNNSLVTAKALLFAVIFQVFLHLRDVYDLPKTRSVPYFAMRLAQALIGSTVVLWVLYYLFPVLLIGRGVFGISLLLISLFLVFWHTLLRVYLGTRKPNSNVLVLGTGRLARELVTEIVKHPELGLRVMGFVDDHPELVGVSIVNPTVLGLCSELPRIVTENNVDRIVVELQDRRGRLPLKELLHFKTRGVAIEEATTVYERVTGKIAIENLKPSWMIFNPGFHVSRRLLLQKRFLSILVSTVLLIVFAPVMLLLMALIKLDSKGPTFYRQQRVGKDGRIFTLWKFRSMCQDAEAKSGAVWAAQDDPRVTRVGRLMRRTRLDELPQLYNIFVGDMSLVGPRPERPKFVEELTEKIPYYGLRHSVKPGITGWAQIHHNYANSVEQTTEKLQYDLFYVKNMSLLLDTLVIFETIKTVLVKKGS
jgi:sugar transferase (PEP-CTERM system associated)